MVAYVLCSYTTLVLAIGLSLFFFVFSSWVRIVVYTQCTTTATLLLPSFLDTCSLSMSSLRCKAFFIITNFIVLKSICLSSSNVHFKNGPPLHHHHHVVPLALISLTLSHHFSLSFIASGRSSGIHPVSSHSCCMRVRAGCPTFARPICGGP